MKVSDIPELAAEAFGWNPFTVRLNSTKPLEWKCKNGHVRITSPGQRVNSGRPITCPQCPEYQALRRQSINSTKASLAESHPEIAALADGWDPTDPNLIVRKVCRSWKCGRGHTWSASIENVLNRVPQGCIQCGSGRGLYVGANDLATVHPEIAAQAHGWDPATVTAGARQKREWICEAGHIWQARVSDRAAGSGCPRCGNRSERPERFDLKTLFPEIAAEADGWDPSTIAAKSRKRLPWKCRKGHTWETKVFNRANGTGCPVCHGKRLLPGYNDLKAVSPEVAAEADGWDPSTVPAKSRLRKPWKCSKGHTWEVRVDTRTKGQGGCPECRHSSKDVMTSLPKIAA